MATTRNTAIFELKTETGDAVNDIKELDKDMTHLADTIGVDVSGSISAMEDKLYELSIQGKQNTKQFKDLQAQTAQYKKVVIETDRSIDALAEQGRGLSNALALAEGTVAGYQAFVGVSAVLGDENEELLATMTKLQAAQGVLNSIMVVKQQLQEKAIVITRLQAGAQSLLALATGKGTKAMKLFRLALISTGIGAIVVGIGLLIANFDKLKGFFTGEKKIAGWFKIAFAPIWLAIEGVKLAVTAFKKLKDSFTSDTSKMIKASKERVAQIQKEEAALNAQLDADKRRSEARIGIFNSEKALAEARGENVAKINAKIDKENIKLLEGEKRRFIESQRLSLARKEELVKRLEAQAKAEAEGEKKFKGSSKELNKQVKINAQLRQQLEEENYAKVQEIENKIALVRQQAWNKSKENLLKAQDEFNKERESKRKEYADKRKAEAQALNDALLAIQYEQQQRMIDLIQQIEQESESFRTSARDKERNAITDHYFQLITEAEQFGLDTADLELAKQAKLKELEDGFAQEDLERQRKAQEMITANRIALMEEGEAKERAKIAEKYAKDLIAIQENENLNAVEKRTLRRQLQLLEEEEMLAITKKYEDEKKQVRLDAFNAYAQTAMSGITAISDLNQVVSDIAIQRAEGDEKKQEKIAKRAFNVNKALQLATATVQGVQAVQNAFTTASASPITTVNPAYPFIQAGIAGVTSAANIAKIASARFQGGSSGSLAPSGGGSVQGAGAGSFAISDNTSTEQTLLNPDGTQANQNQGMSKVFVSETDITDVQDGVEQINTLSTF